MHEIEDLLRSDRDSALIYKTIVGGLPRLARSSRLDRKRPIRSTNSLSGHQAMGVIEAALHARRIGLPLNRHVTIRLERAGVPDSEAVRAVGQFLTRLRDWLRKQGHRTAFAWVRESGPMIGSHVHILLHLPAGVSFSGHRSRRWIEAISGRRYCAGTILTKRIPQAAYDENLGVLVGYLCKGASSEVADRLGLDRRKPGGCIKGKRAGWSQNLGAKARRLWRA